MKHRDTDTYNFEFYPDENNGHEKTTRLSFEMPPDLTCASIHNMCRAFALALGYAPATVDEYFGPESDDVY